MRRSCITRRRRVVRRHRRRRADETLRRSRGGSTGTAAEREAANAILELKCPITHELFYDPVAAPDGHTYERSAIRMWLQDNDFRSPMTRQHMALGQLVRNNRMRARVDAYRAAAGLQEEEEEEEVSSTDEYVPIQPFKYQNGLEGGGTTDWWDNDVDDDTTPAAAAAPYDTQHKYIREATYDISGDGVVKRRVKFRRGMVTVAQVVKEAQKFLSKPITRSLFRKICVRDSNYSCLDLDFEEVVEQRLCIGDLMRPAEDEPVRLDAIVPRDPSDTSKVMLVTTSSH